VTNKLIEYKTEHLSLLDVDGEDIKYLNFDISKIPKPIAFTLLVDNQPVGCGGVAPVIPGVGECWVVIGDVKVFTLCRYLKGIIDKSFSTYHRLQMMIREDNKVNLRFAEYLGFKKEGVQECYDLSCNNYIRMAKLRNEFP